MERLRKLDLASGYTEMLQEVETLRLECNEQLGKSDEAVLTAYKRLSALAAGLQPLSEAAEGAAPHLIVHVMRTAYTLRTQIEQAFAADFQIIYQEIQSRRQKSQTHHSFQCRRKNSCQTVRFR